MANILFTHSYFYRFDPKQWNNHQPYPPLATILAAAYMRKLGHEVHLFDTNLIHDPQEITPHLEKLNPDVLVIYDDGFNYLTKMCLTTMREAAFEMISLAKKRGIKVIANSSDSTDHYEEYINKGADFVLLGEGEISLKELLESFQNNSSPNDISGLAFRIGDEVIKTKPRAVLNDLDKLPLPAWDLIKMEDYREIWMSHHGYFSLNLATTRGCPYKCNWCAKPIYGNRYNSRSPDKVANEIELLINNYKVEYFWMCDDIFGLKPGWAQQFQQIVNERSLRFRYKIQSRVDLLLKEDTIDALAKSGLHEVWVGAESGSQKILDAMDKGTKVEQIYEATRLLKQKKIRVCFFLQFGYLDENTEDIQQTIDMLMELMPDDIGVSVSYPLPGTKFYEKVKQDLSLKANWQDSDDLDLMFENNYSREYYKKLHRYIHKKYRKRQGIQLIKSTLKGKGEFDAKSIRSIILGLFYYTPGMMLDKIQLNRLLKK